jgi:hypothetical protein
MLYGFVCYVRGQKGLVLWSPGKKKGLPATRIPNKINTWKTLKWSKKCQLDPVRIYSVESYIVAIKVQTELREEVANQAARSDALPRILHDDIKIVFPIDMMRVVLLLSVIAAAMAFNLGSTRRSSMQSRYVAIGRNWKSLVTSYLGLGLE